MMYDLKCAEDSTGEPIVVGVIEEFFPPVHQMERIPIRARDRHLRKYVVLGIL